MLRNERKLLCTHFLNCLLTMVCPNEQVLQCYRKTELHFINKRRRGSFLVLFVALLIVALELSKHFMTIPHELGHYYAAKLVGRKVEVYQADFLDEVTALAALRYGASNSTASAQSPSASKVDYSKDGKLGFVTYGPHLLTVNTTVFDSIGEYNTFSSNHSGSVFLPAMNNTSAAIVKIRVDGPDHVEIQVCRMMRAFKKQLKIPACFWLCSTCSWYTCTLQLQVWTAHVLTELSVCAGDSSRQQCQCSTVLCA